MPVSAARSESEGGYEDIKALERWQRDENFRQYESGDNPFGPTIAVLKDVIFVAKMGDVC